MDLPPDRRAREADPGSASAPGRERVRANVASIRARIEAARSKSPRSAPKVSLIVVTKTVPAPFLAWLPDAGVKDVGENRVQTADAKRREAVGGLTWHGIGHLQTNKVRRAIETFDVFHALDSLRLADALEEALAKRGVAWPVYAQVNAARDPAKGGVSPEQALGFLSALSSRPHLDLVGLMTMARESDAGEAARPAFRTLAEIRDEGVRRGLGRHPAAELSMGMTDDFEVAVEEGATAVRVGRAIWEGVSAEPTEGASPAAGPGGAGRGD